MSRVYATSADLAAYMGAPAPSDADALLAKAARFLDSSVFRACWYEVDGSGMPSNTVVQQAMRDAACAQAQWWINLGDSSGAIGAGWGEVRIGTAHLSRSVTNVTGEASPARQVAPEVWDCLSVPELTVDIFRLGQLVTW